METVQVIEEVGDCGSDWFVSLTDNNPEAKDCFKVDSGDEAFRIKLMLENWANK